MLFVHVAAVRSIRNVEWFFKAISQSYYSYYSVLEVKPGQALVVEDMLLETRHVIKEKKSSYELRPGDIVLSRLLVPDEQSIFIGMAPIVIPADYHNYVSDFKKWLLNSIDHSTLTPQQLRNDFETELFEHFFACVHKIFDHPTSAVQQY